MSIFVKELLTQKWEKAHLKVVGGTQRRKGRVKSVKSGGGEGGNPKINSKMFHWRYHFRDLSILAQAISVTFIEK